MRKTKPVDSLHTQTYARTHSRKWFNLIMGTLICIILWECRTEEEFSIQSREVGNIQYGISKQAFLQTKFVSLLDAKSSKNTAGTAAALSPEELSERLDLDKAHLSTHQGKEMLHVPVRVFGSYKRSLLSVSQNQKSYTYLLTYPNPNNPKHFYLTSLSGNLIKEVKLGDDGKEILQQNKSGKNTNGKTADYYCTETVFVTCS